MKDNFAYAAVVVAVLVAITSTWVTNAFDPTEGKALGFLIAKSIAMPYRPEVRYLEPITVIGHRERSDRSAIDDESAQANGRNAKPPRTHNPPAR